ncbi:MAG: hypothetical protein ACI97P_002583 [Arcticibacterium sp.]|jgi:hypothetical protein
MENNIDSKVSVAKTAATQARDKKSTSVKATQARKLKAKEVVSAIPLEQKKEMVTKIKPSAVKEISNEIKALVTSKAKDISKKADFSKNVDEIKTSVKTLNDQIIASTSSIFEDVIEMNKEIADITVKSVEAMASNFDMDKEVEKIRASAVELNEKVVNRSKELNSQVLARTEDLKSTIAKLANDMLENIRLNERITNVKDAVLNSNKYAKDAANNTIDNVEKNATEWQKIGEKAIVRSLKLASKQQELVFETLEEVKSQVLLTRKNLKSLFNAKEV